MATKRSTTSSSTLPTISTRSQKIKQNEVLINNYENKAKEYDEEKKHYEMLIVQLKHLLDDKDKKIDIMLQEQETSSIEFERICKENTELKKKLAQQEMRNMELIDEIVHATKKNSEVIENQEEMNTFNNNLITPLKVQLNDMFTENEDMRAKYETLLAKHNKMKLQRPALKCKKLRAKLVRNIKVNIKDTNSVGTKLELKKLNAECRIIIENCNLHLKENEKLRKSLDQRMIQMEELLTELKKVNVKAVEKIKDMNVKTREFSDVNSETLNVHQNKLCKRPSSVPDPVLCNTTVSSVHQNIDPLLITHHTDHSLAQKIVIFSDEIGRNMGVQLSQESGHSVINMCMPGASYNQIVKNVLTQKFEVSTTIIILIGRRGDVNNKSIVKYFTELNSLKNVDRVVLFALPFSKNLTEGENVTRHKLNVMLHTLTCRHSDKFHFIDLNCLIDVSYLNNDCYYLSRYKKRQLVLSLEYYIKNCIVNLQTPETAVSIEQPGFIYQSSSKEQMPIIDNNLN